VGKDGVVEFDRSLALDFRGLQVLQQVTKDELIRTLRRICIKERLALGRRSKISCPLVVQVFLKTLNFLCSFPADFFQ